MSETCDALWPSVDHPEACYARCGQPAVARTVHGSPPVRYCARCLELLRYFPLIETEPIPSPPSPSHDTPNPKE